MMSMINTFGSFYVNNQRLLITLFILTLLAVMVLFATSGVVEAGPATGGTF